MGKRKTVGKRHSRNPEIAHGVLRYSSTAMNSRAGRYRHAKKGLGKSTPHKKPVVADKMEGRFYQSDDTKTPLRSHRSKKGKIAPLRKSIQKGTVVIILAGRFRGKRVIVLKQLKKSGMLLVTGPYKVNGVPLRRVNQAYVIGTRTKVDLGKLDVSKIEDAFFARKKSAAASSKDGDAFLNKDSADKKKKSPVDAVRKSETSRVGKEIMAILKTQPELKKYLNAKFSLTRGQKPHQMKF